MDFNGVFGTRQGMMNVQRFDITNVRHLAASAVERGRTDGLPESRRFQQAIVDYYLKWKGSSVVNNDASGMRQPSAMTPIVEEPTSGAPQGVADMEM